MRDVFDLLIKGTPFHNSWKDIEQVGQLSLKNSSSDQNIVFIILAPIFKHFTSNGLLDRLLMDQLSFMNISINHSHFSSFTRFLYRSMWWILSLLNASIPIIFLSLMKLSPVILEKFSREY